MTLHYLESILADCEILENICVLKGNSFKAQFYKMIFESILIVGEQQRIPIVICVPENWRQNLIDIYIQNYGDLIFMPHIEKNGKMCLFEKEGILIDQNLPGIVLQSIFRARDILAEGLARANFEDFIEEFELYWCQLSNCRLTHFVVPKVKNSKIVKGTIESVQHRKKEKQSAYLKRLHSKPIYVAENPEILNRWKLGKASIVNSAYFALYPKTIFFPPDIRKEVSLEYLNDLLQLLPLKDAEKILPKLGKNKIIIFEINQPQGNVNYLGFFIEGGKLERNQDGYYLKDVYNLQPLAIHRADKKYLMMRTDDIDIEINRKKILVIGCGSIGGYLICELAKTGYEDITIVDDDILSEENIFRHILGMEYVSKYKCVALEEYIQKNIPEVSIKSLAEKIEDAVIDEDICLEDYDMIISATGNHNLNRWLNSYIIEHRIMKPVIYAWNEVYGIGNHVACFKYGNEGCYECLFGRNEETGELYDKSAYCDAGQKIVQNIDGCGKSFVPYGDMISLKTVLICLSIVRDVFGGKVDDNILVSMKGDESYFRQQGLATSGRYLRQKEDVKKLTGKQFKNIECSVCKNDY